MILKLAKDGSKSSSKEDPSYLKLILKIEELVVKILHLISQTLLK